MSEGCQCGEDISDRNEIGPGEWYLETGFGPRLDGPDHPIFPSLDAARQWIEQRLAWRVERADEAGPR
jgi:hypothetical protein